MKQSAVEYIEVSDDRVTRLAQAILVQAANDYIALLKPRRHRAKNYNVSKEELERFFHSNYYGLLTSIDPDVLINYCKREANGTLDHV